MRLAVLADIHGNLPALQAVLSELERWQPDYVILNGDLINAVPFSPEVVTFVQSQDWVVVRGNHEFYYLDFGTERAPTDAHDPERWGQLHWLVERIAPAQGHYLAMLPDERTLYLPQATPIRVAHGVPGRNRVGFYQNQPAEQILAEIHKIPEPTLLSAHTHVQVDRTVGLETEAESDPFVDPHLNAAQDRSPGVHRRWHVVNPGSVGLPLNGNPAAQFALLDRVDQGAAAGSWQATLLGVRYDRRPALRAFAESGMMAAGGVISQLFYWELVTAEPEIIYFMRWCREKGLDADNHFAAAFHTYARDSGRADHVRGQDPLFNDNGTS